MTIKNIVFINLNSRGTKKERQEVAFTNPMLPMIIKHQSFSYSLSLIIATPNPCTFSQKHNQDNMNVQKVGIISMC